MTIETSIPPATRATRIALAANFVGHGGLGVYARRLAAALDAEEYLVQQVQEGGNRVADPMPADVDLAIRHGWDHSGTNSFAHGDFSHNILPDKVRNVLAFGFVPTLLSEERIEEINRNFSLILCDSRWTAEASRAAGILPKVVALPPPLWPGEENKPVRPARRPFTFLHVSNGDGFVKGTDIVIEAFARAFGDDPNARLILKVSGSGADHLKSGRRTRVLVEGLASRNIELDMRRLDQTAMRDLYTSADCYVHVPRSESLGMPPLEAAACGVPSILHSGGPGLQLSELVPYFLVAHHERALPARIYRDNRAATVFETDADDLTRALIAAANGAQPERTFETPETPAFDEAVRQAIGDLVVSGLTSGVVQ